MSASVIFPLLAAVVNVELMNRIPEAYDDWWWTFVKWVVISNTVIAVINQLFPTT